MKQFLSLSISLFCLVSVQAQTTGPAQPEVQGFMPVNANDMVDLYSGDLNYNIPLMTIPGPEGMSYPINIFYNSNVSMEMMPSMVGLGWNLNTGAIVRNLRGLPDDFKGDTVAQTSYIKPSWTLSFDLTDNLFAKEIAGLDFEKGISAKPSLALYYNNHAGIGVDLGLNIQAVFSDDEKNEDEKSGVIGNLGLNFDNEAGFSLSPNLSYDKLKKAFFESFDQGTRKTTKIGATFNSKQGFGDVTIGHYRKAKDIFNETFGDNTMKVSFAVSAPLARIKQKRYTNTTRFGFTIDPEKIGLPKDSKKNTISGSFMRSWVSKDVHEVKAYGAMHMDNWQDEKYNKNIITDFYRENDGQMHKKKMLTPIPVMSYDLFTVQGHGVGGTFRVHQGSIGRLSDSKTNSTTTSQTIDAEIGFGGAYKLGGEYAGSYGNSYSGPWKSPNKYLDHLQFGFEGISASNPLFEPSYFKMIGEPSFMPEREWALYRRDTAIAFDILATWTKTKAYSNFNRLENTSFDKRINENRIKRVNHIEYYTKTEIEQRYETQPITIEDENGANKPIDYTQGKNHHIHGYTVRKSNGVQYNYLLPAYNTETVRETFTIPSGITWEYDGTNFTSPEKLKVVQKLEHLNILGSVVTSNVADFAKVNNGAGDEYYSKEEIPAYAHTYFLTSILSPDYVDIDHNGPTENDLGTYVKFNYYEVKDYKWRFPYKGYYYARGYMDNDDDDKASVQYGTKDLYYVKSIESKTHIAIFEYDNIETMLLEDANGQLKNKKLVRIKLFSKTAGGQYSTPTQIVHFKQNYELKKGTMNSVAANKGVLTLNELAFTYQDNNKGELTPYKFEYGNNINYAVHEQDIWGAYQPDFFANNRYNSENPFTYQYDHPNRNSNAASWLLNKITLPSKGEIHIDYEKDDYAFVQNKKAMSYLELIGTSDRVHSSTSSIGSQLKNDNLYLYFRSPVKLNSKSDVGKLIEGIEYLKFRIFVELRKKDLSRDFAKDYVEGYATLNTSEYDKISDYVGYIKISTIRPKSISQEFNPLRLATFQYIRKSRPDLGPEYNHPSNLTPFIFARYLPDMLSEFSSLFGYYGTAQIKGFAASLAGEKPSFVRLNMPYKKYGGGARVKEVTLLSHDINEKMSKDSIYGQEYKYLLEDGLTSSGVAEFEPLVGISENPFTQPIFYGKKNKIIFADGGYLPEEPRGAGLFPSAKVGYSRVSVRNKVYRTATDTVSLSQSGINISEFYTAKDFPTRTDRKGALYAPMKIPSVPIPFIGSITYQHSGYSMGYQFEKFEGIYGSLKSVATYPYALDEPTIPPIQKAVYHYKKAQNDQKALDDQVTVLHKEGVKEQVYLNKNIDFYIDEIEASSFHTKLGIQPNLSYMPPVQFLPSLFPSFSYLNKSTRYLTTNKIVYTYPVLEKVEQFKDGAKVTTSNLVYDGETGESIITSVTNEWEKPVYTYNFPAHWTYEQMKGAYKNYKALVNVQTSGGQFKLGAGTVGGQIPTEYLEEGDRLKMIPDPTSPSSYNPEPFYVSNLDRIANTFELKTRNNSNASAGSYYISKSGFKNLQSLKKGHVVSLVDYSTYQGFNTSLNWNYLMYLYNQSVSASLINPTNPPSIMGEMKTRQECVDIDFKSEYSVRTYQVGNVIDTINEVYLKLNWNNGCILDFSLGTSNDTDGKPYTNLDLKDFRFNPTLSNSDTLVMDYIGRLGGTGITRSRFYAYASPECVFNCDTVPIPVLQASAIEYKNDFELNYKHLEDESTDLPYNLTQIRDNGSGNPYAYGIKGIWRPWRTSSYLEKRKQTQPNIYGEQLRLDRDGEFDFYWFDWTKPISYNEGHNWRWVNEVTQYNPNGLSQEGKNRLDIYSASVFGYNNHLVTASASNSKTTDIAFDSFEDYPVDASNIYTGRGHGNLNFKKSVGSINYELYDAGSSGRYSHTGKKSLLLKGNSACTECYKYKADFSSQSFFTPKEENEYYISIWTKAVPFANENNTVPSTKIEILINGGLNQSFGVLNNAEPIDGWYKIEGVFKAPIGISSFELRLINSTSKDMLVDDIRIQPFHSGMETYVYDPENYRLKATLNNQNFATFYVYDEEGSLVSTKVETEEGIKTISTNRNNIHQD